MSSIIIRCEDGAPQGRTCATLLEGAKMHHLQQMAHAGAAGLIRPRGPVAAIDRWAIHQGFLKLDPQEPAGAPGRWYAASTNTQLAPSETVWCCDFVTQQDGRLIDPTAGGISTKETEVLIHSLEEQLGSETRRWEVGEGSQHLLVTSDPALAATSQISAPSPELLINQAWESVLPKKPIGAAVALLLREAMKVLDQHPVNRVRVDLGENPANLLWLWGAATVSAATERSRRRPEQTAAIVSSVFPMRGVATLLGWDWQRGPTSFEESAMQQLAQMIRRLVGHREFVYVHLRMTSPDAVERLCAMERLDQLVLKPLTETLPQQGPWRLLVAIDDRHMATVPIVALGTELSHHPVAGLTTQQLGDGGLVFEDSAAACAWLTHGAPSIAST